MAFIYRVFRTKHDQSRSQQLARFNFLAHNGYEIDWGGDVRSLLGSQRSWVNWAILRLGPYAFFRQWVPWDSGTPRFLVKDKLRCVWKNTSHEAKGLQMSYAQLIRGPLAYDARGAFLHREIAVFDAGGNQDPEVPLAHDWIDDISFLIDFRS